MSAKTPPPAGATTPKTPLLKTLSMENYQPDPDILAAFTRQCRGDRTEATQKKQTQAPRPPVG